MHDIFVGRPRFLRSSGNRNLLLLCELNEVTATLESFEELRDAPRGNDLSLENKFESLRKAPYRSGRNGVAGHVLLSDLSLRSAVYIYMA